MKNASLCEWKRAARKMSSKSKKIIHTDSLSTKTETSNSLQWSEWSDIELNAEPWDYPKIGEFSDPQQVVMPKSLQPFDWKRFGETKYITAPIMYDEISNYPDLITNNVHLLHSEFVRSFISTLINIQYCGRNGLDVENPGSNFSWNFGDQPWHGWFHIYSLNKAGKGAAHRPVINPKGRYVVRIFHMGCWRRILIDDSIPIDKRERPLLPRTSNVNELWPMILAKAMLKIASLSWTTKREIVDCSLITCLTGWIDLSLNVSHLSPRDQWEFLIKYAKHFEWSKDENMDTDQFKSEVLEKGGKSRKSKTKVTKLQVLEEPEPTLLFLSIDDTRNVQDEGIPGVTPCWNHEIYVELSRDVPLDPAQVKPPLANWKSHRWIDWAIRQGLADPTEFFVPIRRLLIVSPLKQSSNILHDYTEEFGDDSSDATLETKDEYIIKSSNVREKIVDNEIPDISLWADFNKMSYYLRQIHLFYRPKIFKYSAEVSDNVKSTFGQDARKSRADISTRDGKKSGRKSSRASTFPDKTYEYEDKSWQSRNEPLYLFVDSTDDKFFLINFSVVNYENFEDSSSKRCSSLLIERYSWFEKSMMNDTIAIIKTRGTKSLVMQLEAGRHLLKIFINSESSYRASLLSDTPFEIGNRLKMHELMTIEADRIKDAGRRISECIKKGFESFGTENFAINLKLLYQSYMPDSQKLEKSNLKIVKLIHVWFLNELSNIIAKTFSSSDLPIIFRAVRIFFIDPTIGMTLPIIDSSKNSLNNEKAFRESSDNATILQSFFRMSRIKNYRNIHDKSHVEHEKVKSSLSKIVELFDSERDENLANFLIREIIKRNNHLTTLYPWSKDLKHVIEVQEIVGRVTNITIDRWIPILRILVNPKEDEIVFASMDLFVDIGNYTIRVFDNDTNREMSRLVNNVETNRYQNRQNGYTIFAYGWNDFQSLKDWSLHLTTVKGEPMFDRINGKVSMGEKIEIPSMSIVPIADNYLPNPRNLIFKVIAKITRNSLVSIRFTTSYEKVLTELRIVKNNGSTLMEIKGGGTIIVPYVYMEHDEVTEIPVDERLSKSRKSLNRKSGGGSLSNRSASKRDSIQTPIFDKSTRYIIEAHVREDSWPLTLKEWKVVADAKNRDSDKNGRDKKSSTTGRKSERSRLSSRKFLETEMKVEKPFWRLQIITESGNPLEIIRDSSKEDKIADLRKIWKIDESERLKRGQKLRENFLDENCLVIARSAMQLTNISTRKSDEIEEIVDSVDSSTWEISEKRMHEPPANFANYLPKLDLTIYMNREEEEEDRWVKTDFDEETLSNQRAMNVIDFEQSQLEFLEKSEDMMAKRREKYQLVINRYLENRENRARDMNDAYDARQALVESTKSTVESVKSKDSIKTKKGR